MMVQPLTNCLAHICTTIKSSFMPALFLAAALVMFYAQNPFDFQLSQIFYDIFLGVSVLGLLLLFMTNQSKPFFSFFVGVAAFLAFNWMKKQYSAEIKLCPQYIWLGFILPVNLLLFYFLPIRRLKSKYGSVLLFVILVQLALAEHADSYMAEIAGGKLWLWYVVCWLVALSILAIDISFKNTLVNTGLFYADTALFLGFMYADSASGISVFGLSFAVILFSVTLFDLYYRYRYDSLKNVYSYNVYLARALGKFPFKYTVGVFCLDNREKIIAQIGEKNIGVLEQMLIDKLIDEAPEDTEFYRYKGDEFLMVFKNEDAKHSYEYCDNMRRAVAAAEFILNSKQTIKMTISVCVSEKTRKYIEANVVVERGHNGLQKGGRFNSNIVTIV